MTEEMMAHEEVFDRLREILATYQGRLAVLADGPTSYELGAPTLPSKSGRFLAAVRNGKAYASFHLMTVYAYPDMLDEISPELRRRMQGKSCFNFSRVDETLFAELASLTARGFERFGEVGFARMSTGSPSR
jgi:pyridoxal biosynthesis lyase PdxS